MKSIGMLFFYQTHKKRKNILLFSLYSCCVEPHFNFGLTFTNLIFFCLFCSIFENGPENCSKEIEAHKECMRKLGFKI